MKVDCGISVTQQQSGNQTSILGDPKAISKGKGKSKTACENSEKESCKAS